MSTGHSPLNIKSHAEGYVNVTICPDCGEKKMDFNYVYQYKDHLGNIRLSYGYDEKEEVLKVIEENHYYPFGLKHTKYNTGEGKYKPDEVYPELMRISPLGDGEKMMYRYKFLGQERQEELGLNWDSFRHRNYDYAIGRFMGIDPISEEYMSISTYQFAHNNPVWKIEIEGLEGEPSNGKTDITNHEPVKIVKSSPQTSGAAPVLQPYAAMEVVREGTPEVVKKVAKGLVKGGVRVIGKVLGTAAMLLTDTMSPNVGGNTNEADWMRRRQAGVDKKLSLEDHKLLDKLIEETGIKRLYEDNPKHGKNKKGNASAAPKSPQEVLENSVELPGNTTRRVGVDAENNEFNVFDEHTEGKFHGHVRAWEELTQDMKNVLIDAGFVNRKGKILNNKK